MIRVGDTVMHYISGVEAEHGDKILRRGTIVYIHPEGRYYTAEFEVGGCRIRESYKILDTEMALSAKGFLMRARKMDTRLKALKEARLNAWSRATSLTQRIEHATATGSDVSRKAERYAELIDEIDRQEREIAEVKRSTLKVIGEVEDNTLAALLTAYYVNGKTWEQTAVELHYSFYHTIHRLHPQALKAVEEVLREKTL